MPLPLLLALFNPQPVPRVARANERPGPQTDARDGRFYHPIYEAVEAWAGTIDASGAVSELPL
jgi:hypothetical protein